MVATVMRAYPSYTLQHFYTKSFLQGGLTLDQVMFLFESYDKEQYAQQRFVAAIHGVDIESKDTSQGASAALPASTTNKEKPFLFGDPADYKHMTEEEKAEATKKMMGFWKPFAEGSLQTPSPKLAG